MPFIDLAGIYLGTGQKHRVTYTTRKQFSLGPPYSDCTDKIPNMLQKFIWLCYFNYSLRYSQCGCVNPYVWSIRMIVLPGTIEVIKAPLCNTTDKCYSEAAARFLVDTSILADFCFERQSECSTVSYLQRVSSLSAPLP